MASLMQHPTSLGTVCWTIRSTSSRLAGDTLYTAYNKVVPSQHDVARCNLRHPESRVKVLIDYAIQTRLVPRRELYVGLPDARFFLDFPRYGPSA